MAGHRWLIPPTRGLLLCILALQLCLQDSLATAAANTMVVATKSTSAATKNTSAATKSTSAATKSTLAATKNVLAGAVTTKKASLVPVTTKNTSMATQNAAVVAVTKTAMVVATTKNAAVVATANTSVATKNTLVIVKATENALTATKGTSVVATATKNTSAATKNALMVVATTKGASEATKNAPVVEVTNNATVVAATNNASLVATNTSEKGAEEPMQTCQSFQCSGERCYEDGAHANRTTTCHNETFCELYRFSSTNYTARCSSGCSTQPCSTNSSVSRQQCSLECCAGPLCLQLNASAYGDLPPPSTTVPPTTTTSTPRPPPQNGKVCAAFSCHGDNCFKGRKTITRCILGQDFCEMKKTGLNYVAGCSKACKAAKPVCAGGVKAACFQECCPASPKASCLKLDGKVHVSSAGQVTLAPLLKVMACGVVLLLSYRVWG